MYSWWFTYHMVVIFSFKKIIYYIMYNVFFKNIFPTFTKSKFSFGSVFVNVWYSVFSQYSNCHMTCFSYRFYCIWQVLFVSVLYLYYKISLWYLNCEYEVCSCSIVYLFCMDDMCYVFSVCITRELPLLTIRGSAYYLTQIFHVVFLAIAYSLPIQYTV